jgi:hypothetical protein
MPKKSKGKVPLNKAQTKNVRKVERIVKNHQGLGERGFWGLLFRRGS